MEVMMIGGGVFVVFNVVDEIVVVVFLNGKIGFFDILVVVEVVFEGFVKSGWLGIFVIVFDVLSFD